MEATGDRVSDTWTSTKIHYQFQSYNKWPKRKGKLLISFCLQLPRGETKQLINILILIVVNEFGKRGAVGEMLKMSGKKENVSCLKSRYILRGRLLTKCMFCLFIVLPGNYLKSCRRLLLIIFKM